MWLAPAAPVVATHVVRPSARPSGRQSDEWLLAASAVVVVFVLLFSLQQDRSGVQDYAQNRAEVRTATAAERFVEEIDVVAVPDDKGRHCRGAPFVKLFVGSFPLGSSFRLISERVCFFRVCFHPKKLKRDITGISPQFNGTLWFHKLC